jgi:hypothetical protein
MKTKLELEQAIIGITTTIRNKFPELSKYIIEMPENNSSGDEINTNALEDYYFSLEDLVKNYAITHKHSMTKNKAEVPPISGYPLYPPSEDIYQQSKEEADINPENISKRKTTNPKVGMLNEKDFKDDMSGDDLDIPGSELDDQQESVGSEDEENNYYSLGGDNHNDLEEDNG